MIVLPAACSSHVITKRPEWRVDISALTKNESALKKLYRSIYKLALDSQWELYMWWTAWLGSADMSSPVCGRATAAWSRIHQVYSAACGAPESCGADDAVARRVAASLCQNNIEEPEWRDGEGALRLNNPHVRARPGLIGSDWAALGWQTVVDVSLKCAEVNCKTQLLKVRLKKNVSSFARTRIQTHKDFFFFSKFQQLFIF